MARRVRTEASLVSLPKGPDNETQRIEASGTEVTLTDAEYARLSPTAFTSGKLTDLGAVAEPGDAVVTQAAAVTMASTVAAGANPTKAEFDALRTDVSNILAALKGAGKPMAP